MGWMFRLEPLLEEMNTSRRNAGLRPLTWTQVAPLLGMSRQVLQNLASNRKLMATNTRFLESMCRFFNCGLPELLMLAPPRMDAIDHWDVERLVALGRELHPDERPSYHVEVLYGEDAEGRWTRDRAAAERQRPDGRQRA